MSYDVFYQKLNSIINDTLKQHELLPNSIQLISNFSKKGVISSRTICITEPEYPSMSANSFSGSSPVLNLKESSGKIEVLVRNKQFAYISIPSDAEIKELASDKAFKHILFSLYSNTVYDYIVSNISYCISNYSSGSSFGCCGLFKKCSELKKCVHVNKLYAKGCQYRSNLESGHIFY